ncbi:Follistatin [Mizuhopecten yessoensis]|uniref:Follistatin n=1 Tax=Mizuhopecten yessoensis TaxID=6573 RepID=A0A210QPJ3_MIZYE|nr:Follistatin [Mizuhopecten yessoensis]
MTGSVNTATLLPYHVCRGFFCPWGGTCKVNQTTSQPYCECMRECPTQGRTSIVCGTNGVTYVSKCWLQKSSCERRIRVRVRHEEKCADMKLPEPCAGFVCEPPKVCQLGNERRPVCRCAETCPDTLELVCGSDGATYSNICRLEMEACRTMRDIRLHHSGKCQAVSGPNVNIVVQDEVEAYQGKKNVQYNHVKFPWQQTYFSASCLLAGRK